MSTNLIVKQAQFIASCQFWGSGQWPVFHEEMKASAVAMNCDTQKLQGRWSKFER